MHSSQFEYQFLKSSLRLEPLICLVVGSEKLAVVWLEGVVHIINKLADLSIHSFWAASAPRPDWRKWKCFWKKFWEVRNTLKIRNTHVSLLHPVQHRETGTWTDGVDEIHLALLDYDEEVGQYWENDDDDLIWMTLRYFIYGCWWCW